MYFDKNIARRTIQNAKNEINWRLECITNKYHVQDMSTTMAELEDIRNHCLVIKRAILFLRNTEKSFIDKL